MIGKSITIGKEFILYSKVLEENRSIIVSLPDGYDKGDGNYPVLYLLDGFQNIRHVVGTVELLTSTGNIAPIIIVGIKSNNRTRDFTPSTVGGWTDSGRGSIFCDFIANELIPYVESRYRTHCYRILEGHSLGGLFTAYVLMERTKLFNAYIIMSPALWWNNEELTKCATSFFETNSDLDKSLFLGIGSEDGQGMKQELKRFVREVEKCNSDNLRWKHIELEGEGHMSAPLLLNYRGLKFVFADMQFPENLWESFDEFTFLTHETNMINKYGKEAKQSGESYVNLGMKLMKEKNYRGAITVFKQNVQAFSGYPRSYEWLGDAYEMNQDYTQAIENYQKAYELSVEINFGQEKEYKSKIERLKAKLVV